MGITRRNTRTVNTTGCAAGSLPVEKPSDQLGPVPFLIRPPQSACTGFPRITMFMAHCPPCLSRVIWEICVWPNPLAPPIIPEWRDPFRQALRVYLGWGLRLAKSCHDSPRKQQVSCSWYLTTGVENQFFIHKPDISLNTKYHPHLITLVSNRNKGLRSSELMGFKPLISSLLFLSGEYLIISLDFCTIY